MSENNRNNLKNKETYNQLVVDGLNEIKNRKFINAVSIFKKAIYLEDSFHEAYINLANLYNILSKKEESINILNEYIKKNNFHEDVVNTLVINYFNQNKYEDFKKIFKKYCTRKENKIMFLLRGKFYINQKKTTKAIKLFENKISKKINYWPFYDELMGLYEKTNKINELNDLIIKSKKIFNKEIKFIYYEALYLSRIGNNNFSINKIKKYNLEEKITDKKILCLLYDLLCINYEKIGELNKSYYYAIKRNNILINLDENKNFDEKIILETIKVYKSFYSHKHDYKELIGKNSHEVNITFLVGFPRSGTTLLDTILRSHKKTLVLEERPFLLKLRHEFLKKNSLEKLKSISSNKIYEMQQEYFSNIKYNANTDKVIVDKFPLNIIEIGFIKKIFPNAKFILAIRHPLDTITSCVLTHFKMNDAMANFINLEKAALFYDEVFSLFKIYENNLNINFHKIKYEDVVLSFEPTINDLLNFLELKYEKNINKFYLTALKRSKINTPSYKQVVKPIYRSSIDKYKNLSNIDEVRPVVSKWIKEFKYL